MKIDKIELTEHGYPESKSLKRIFLGKARQICLFFSLILMLTNLVALMAEEIFTSGLYDNGHPSLTLKIAEGESCEIQSSTDLINWNSLVTLSGNGSTRIYTDSFTSVFASPKIFYRAATLQTPNGSLANGDVLSIRQTWPQEPKGVDRTADVLVPSGEGPFPVVIFLHGMGGNSGFIRSLDPYVNKVIRVAPNGYRKSWNIDAEPSKAPDVAFIHELLNLLKKYDNVDAGKISIFGLSNGSALINRLLIELNGAAFQKAACSSAQMITKMYRRGSFWHSVTSDNRYEQKITPAPGRKIITISGTDDRVIPYLGGSAVGTTFLNCQVSLYRFAQAMGHTGSKIADANGIPGNLHDSDPTNDYPPEFVKYSYLNGQVVHYKLLGGRHGLNSEARRITAEFLLE